ncbi:MAG: hypothetical protein ACRD3A_14850, partial [Terriglobales bacterium]
SVGQTERALAVLRQAHARNPRDRNVLAELVSLSRERGALGEALEYAKKLAVLSPGDLGAQRLIQQLEREQAR